MNANTLVSGKACPRRKYDLTFKGENTLLAEGERVTVQPINVRRRIPQQAAEKYLKAFLQEHG
jgi:hypothetical protein